MKVEAGGDGGGNAVPTFNSTKLSPEQLLAELEELLRTMPAGGNLAQNDMATMEWVGRTASIFNLLGSQLSMSFDLVKLELFSAFQDARLRSVPKLVALFHQARNTLILETRGPRSNAIVQGGVFDYFDEVRKIVETANHDLFFIDPYMEAEFVSRFLTTVPATVAVRLLCKDPKSLTALLPAVGLLSKQNGTSIAVRTVSTIHDRYVIVDGTACYQSGASFKDGAKNAPTLVTQIIDAFEQVCKMYEDLWSKATVHI